VCTDAENGPIAGSPSIEPNRRDGEIASEEVIPMI
jgi:hypothetical protein